MTAENWNRDAAFRKTVFRKNPDELTSIESDVTAAIDLTAPMFTMASSSVAALPVTSLTTPVVTVSSLALAQAAQPITPLHYTTNANVVNGVYVPGAYGFNLADVTSMGGLNALPAGVKGLVYTGNLNNGADAAFIATMTPFIGNPHLYGFYLADEPDPTGKYGTIYTAANLKAESDWIHAHIPGAVTYITMMDMGSPDAPSFMNTYNPANTGIDLYGLDPYPVRPVFPGGFDPTIIPAAVNAAVAAGIPLSKIVPVYQAFGEAAPVEWALPTAAQETAILAAWGAAVPRPAFDYAYSWGVQNGDRALSQSKELQAVFAAHNARTLDWIGVSGSSFANVAGWNDITNGLSPAWNVPGAVDTARFLTGGGSITGNGTMAMLQMGGAAGWNLTSSSRLVGRSSITIGQGGAGTLLINGGASINGLGVTDIVSGVSGQTAAVTVDGAGSAWSSTGELIAGDAGTGNVTISNNASLSAAGTASAPAMALGAAPGGNGSLTITGAKATLVGQLNVGQAGNGSLAIQNQGTVRTGGAAASPTQGVVIGQTATGSGNITVSGTKSLLANSGQFVAGDVGQGSLSINGGGTVVTSPGAAAGIAGAVIANTALASGSSANISGAGSNWLVAGSLIVGNAGFAQLGISQGGSVTAASLDLAALAGATGIASVAGLGSLLSISGDIVIGDRATGKLSVIGGAHVEAANIYVGGDTPGGGSGNLDVQGTGSQLTVTGTIFVGAEGPGVFTLGKGTSLIGTEKTLINGVANLGGLNDPPYIPNDGINNLLDGYIGDADIAVQNSGLFDVKPGTATLNSPLITFDPAPEFPGQSGQWKIENGGTLILNTTTVDSSQVISFNGTAGVLVLGQAPYADPALLDFEGAPTITGEIKAGSPNVLPGFRAPIQNYKAGDKILFNGLTFGSSTRTGNIVTLWSGANGTGIDLGGLTFVTPFFAPDTVGATAAAAQIAALACFAEGTLIETVTGPRAVETLCAGDEVRTLLGGPAESCGSAPGR